MKRLIITLTIISLALTAHAEAVSITVGEANGQVIPAAIYGQFSEHLGRCIYDGIWVGDTSSIENINGYRKDIVEALRTLKIPVLRWPGGCFADDYHWMDGIGPKEQRTLICNNNWGGDLEDNSFGTHEFLNLCELLETEPYISGNVGSGTPEELAKWVEYMTSDSRSTVVGMRRANGRDKAWNVKYIGIGNEAWGCGGNMTPEYYSDLFRRYTTYTRNYNGRLYKIASGSSADDYHWMEVLMQRIGTMMDGISVHYYTVPEDWTHHGSATEFSSKDYYTTLSKALAIDPMLKRHIEIMNRYDPENKVDLLVDEWGTWYDVEPGTNPGHLYQQNTMRDAMVAALSLNVFHKYSYRIKMANIAQVVNVLQSMILTRGNQMVLTPTYHVFRLYNVHQDAEYLPLQFSSPITEGVPTVDATASRKEGKTHITLCCTSLSESQTVTLEGVSGKLLSAEILTAKDVRTANTFEAPASVAPQPFRGVKMSKKNLTITLPACSIVAIELQD